MKQDEDPLPIGSLEVDDTEIADEAPPPERVERETFLLNFAAALHDPIGDLKWVFQALGAKDLTPKDAPSAGAWALLTTLQTDEVLLKGFYTTVFPKLLPSKTQIDKGEDRVDDGRKLFGIIEQLLREPPDDADLLSDTEKRARELAVSRAGSPGRL